MKYWGLFGMALALRIIGVLIPKTLPLEILRYCGYIKCICLSNCAILSLDK